jgi:tRNA(adenine34) deaminase
LLFGKDRDTVTDDRDFMQKALEEARAALADGEFPVGCVLVGGHRILASGRRRGTTRATPNEIDHAEMVALRQLAALKADLERSHLTAYCTMEPCLMCYAALLLNGVRRIVYAYEDAMGGVTGCDFGALPALYRQNAVKVVPGVLRQESLELFKAFFAAPANHYWRNSLLAEYTLNQP